MKKNPPSVRHNFIKGDFAESIVCRLFESLDFHILYSGIEVTNPMLIYWRRENLLRKSDIAKDSAKADFIGLREPNGQAPGLRLDIEVKFSVTGKIPSERISSYADDTHFIFVDTENFWSVSKQDLNRSKSHDNDQIIFASLSSLEDEKIFGFSLGQKQTIKDHKPLLAILGEISGRLASENPDPLKKSAPRIFPKNHHALWPAEDEQKLREEFRILIIRYNQDDAIDLLASQFDRSRNSIVKKLQNLGLLPSAISNNGQT